MNRLKVVQKSLVEVNQTLIAKITPTLGKTKDVETAVSLARLQHSAYRLHRINEMLEALARGAKLDGQTEDGLESLRKARRIMALLEIRLQERKENAPPKKAMIQQQDRPKGGSISTTDSNEPNEETGTYREHATTTSSMGTVVIDHRTQEFSPMAI